MIRSNWRYYFYISMLAVILGSLSMNNKTIKDTTLTVDTSVENSDFSPSMSDYNYDSILDISEEESEEGYSYKIEGTGTYFEILDSSYLDVTLTSSEVIEVMFESIPKMINLYIESVYVVQTTELTISGFIPDTVYYHYQDGRIVRGFKATSFGEYSFEQNIISPHHIYIMEESSTVYILANGTVSGTSNITRNGDVYTFIDDVQDSIIIERSNIVLDGANHYLIGSNTGNGIYTINQDALTIKNVQIRNFTRGIYLVLSNNSIITNNDLRHHEGGVYLTAAYNANVSNNHIFNCQTSVRLMNSIECVVSYNNLSYNENVISFQNTNYSKALYNNITGYMLDSGYPEAGPGVGLYSDSNNNLMQGNNISGKYRTFYSTNYADNNSYIGNELYDGDIYLRDSQFIYIKSNNIVDAGILSFDCNYGNNTILGNTIIGGGIQADNNTLIFGNNIMNSTNAIAITSTSDVIIRNNNITNAEFRGLFIIISSNCHVEGNIFTNTTLGIQSAGTSLYNNITKNIFRNNSGYAIELGGLALNYTITFNDFYGNAEGQTSQATSNVIIVPSNNTFIYNFWDDWVSPDNNNDSYVDLPYAIDGSAGNEDPFPLAGSSILDADQDGLTDFEELLLGTDPQNPDSDGDLLTDGDEMDIYFTNPLMNDTDSDGLDDFEEVNIGLDGFYTDPLLNDTDADLLDDFEEVNLGLDGFLTDPTLDDTDMDGLLDGEEFDYSSNPLIQDSDSDDLLDGEEVHSYGTSPTNNDTESDGLPDGYEVANGLSPLLDDADEDPDVDDLTNLEEYYEGTDPQNADTDGDSYNDGEEVAAGTDPLDPNDFPQPITERPLFPPITEDPTAAIIITTAAIVSATIVSGLMIQSIIGKGVDLLTDNLGKTVLANQELLGSIKDQVSGLVKKINKELVEVKNCPKCGTKVVSAYCHLCGTTTDFEKARLLKERILED